ncbi:MAG TPA: o-succinylbenzoate--CoA ligase [bacterium]|nr:o-succinylbenzoate--CoA ligase [bacterium]
MTTIEYPTIRWARAIPDHPAVITAGLVVTYRRLEALIGSAVGTLRQHGVGPGDRVVVCGVNSLDWIVTAHALMRLGATLIAARTQLLPTEARALMERFHPRLVLCDPALQDRWPSSWPLTVISQPSSASDVPAEIDPDSLCTIVFTSGSGGEPKGIGLTFRNHLAGALASALNLGVQPDDRWLLNLPAFHIGGLAIILRAAIYGTTVVVHDRFDPAATWRAIREDRVTQLSLVATTLRRLLDVEPESRCPGWVRSALVGGGPAPSALLDSARDRGFPVLPTYGMTETASQIATLAPWAPPAKRHTAGMALPLAEIAIRDEHGQAVAAECEGQIHLRGPMVASAYFDRAGAARPLAGADGWMPTRDVGSLDQDGYLTVHGRIDQVIISGGEKIHAEEIENVLAEMATVIRAAVVGVPDAEWGEAPAAMIERVPGSADSVEDVRAFLAVRLPRFKLPRIIEFVDGLPTLPSGKPDRQALRERYLTR